MSGPELNHIESMSTAVVDRVQGFDGGSATHACEELDSHMHWALWPEYADRWLGCSRIFDQAQ